MKRPPKLRYHQVEPCKLERIDNTHTGTYPYYPHNTALHGPLTIQSTIVPAYRITIAMDELEQYEQYCRNYDEEEQIRRSDPRLIKLWHDYQILLGLLR